MVVMVRVFVSGLRVSPQMVFCSSTYLIHMSTLKTNATTKRMN